MMWRVYYLGGFTFSSEDGSPFDAPTTGVQVIVQADPDVGRFLTCQVDFYWWEADKQQWFGGDQAGFYQYLFGPGPKMVLFGRCINHRDYQDCVKAALEDHDFEVKSALQPGEKF